MVINQAMRNTNVHSSARVMGDTFVVSEKFISNCLKFFDEAMQLKAHKVETRVQRQIQLLSTCRQRMWSGIVLQEFKNNPVFLITEEDLKRASILTESFTPSKKDKKEAERRKKTTGVFRPPLSETYFQLRCRNIPDVVAFHVVKGMTWKVPFL